MRSNAILVIKAVAIVGVVLHHISNRRFDSTTVEHIGIIVSFFSWSVLAFIGVAGWLHAASEEKKPRNLVYFLKQRAFRLLIPYVALVILYSLVWQAIQLVGLQNIGVRQSPTFAGKLYHTIPLLDYNPVAEQLYFLPLLFVIGVVVHSSMKIYRIVGPSLVCIGSIVVGIALIPSAGNTGFSMEMLLFGSFCYSAGALLYYSRYYLGRYLVVGVIAILVLFFLGASGLPKVVPVVMMAFIPALDRLSVPVLNWIGDASGTIYAYHTPFILQPFVLGVATLPSSFHFAGAIVSTLLAVLICATLHHGLKGTVARKALM